MFSCTYPVNASCSPDTGPGNETARLHFMMNLILCNPHGMCGRDPGNETWYVWEGAWERDMACVGGTLGTRLGMCGREPGNETDTAFHFVFTSYGSVGPFS